MVGNGVDVLAGYGCQSNAPLGLERNAYLQYRGYKDAFGKLAMKY